MDIVSYIDSRTKEYVQSKPKTKRKAIGQFFTDSETAKFMAGLYAPPNDMDYISVLDPGAGTGILAGAMIERLQSFDIKGADIVCYEKNEEVLDLLDANLRHAAECSKFPIKYKIIHEDYILSQSGQYNSLFSAADDCVKYDAVISNPPYIKLSKDSCEASVMRDVCYGAPNLYFMFVSMGAFNLRDDGTLIYIIPRSWTSGAYFRQFRQSFFRKCSIEHIHLFASRDEVFGGEDVLQETMIMKARKTTARNECITITSSFSSGDFSDINAFKVPYATVVSGRDDYVYLPVSNEEKEALERLRRLKDTLPSIGLKMKTGLTVDFRNRESLKNAPDPSAVPLFYSQHIRDGKVIFPVGKDFEYISADKPALLQKNANYLFVKRFTAKEERRRLQCGVYLAKDFPTYSRISTQNKINFIDGADGLQENIVFGLYVMFNSSLYDTYYRVLNGSTQVNSTEINAMPVPPISAIISMGEELIRSGDMSESACDRILEVYV